MNVTVKIHKVNKEGSKTKAFASITVDGWLAVNDIAIVSGKNGLFISMPQKKDESAENGYRDIAFPVTKESREELSKIILDAYNQA